MNVNNTARVTAPSLSLRHALRLQTADAHDRLDSDLAGFALDVADDYRAFLAIHRTGLLSLAPLLRPEDHAELVRVIHTLGHDIAAMDGNIAHPQIVASPQHPADGGWGASYVLRGSRLGSAMLAKSVAAHLPKTYLTTPLDCPWGAFVEQLDAHGETLDDSGRYQVIDGALTAFGAFAGALPPATIGHAA